MKLINIGFGSMVAANRVLAILAPDSAPIKRVIQEARDRGMLIDASYGRKTKAVLLMDTDHVILSAIPPESVYPLDDKAGKDRGGQHESGKLLWIPVLRRWERVRSETCDENRKDRDSVPHHKAPRPDEKDGVNYYSYKTRFEDMIAATRS